MTKPVWIFWWIALTLPALGAAMWWSVRPAELPPPPASYVVPEPLPTSALPDWSEVVVKVERGQNITSILINQGVPHVRTAAVVAAAKPHSNLVKIRAGGRLTFRWNRGQAVALVQSLDPWDEQLLVVSLGEVPEASIERREVKKRPVAVAGEVHYTLWDTGVSMGLRPQNLIDLAKIFAWDIDFNTQIQRGDRIRLVVEEIRDARSDALVRYGEILAAEYLRSNGKKHVAYRYVGSDDAVGFFDAEGDSSKTPFLKSPIEFSRVSSRFGKRYHPILKRWRAHRGTDYAAGTGTPVRTIGDGVVSFVGVKGGYGRHVRIRHNEEHASSYSHLSSYAGMKTGRSVRQGDVIGEVGSTGLATGPHLHFEFYQNEQQVNYAGLEFDRTQPISEEERPNFEKLLGELRPLLEGTLWPRETCEEPLPLR